MNARIEKLEDGSEIVNAYNDNDELVCSLCSVPEEPGQVSRLHLADRGRVVLIAARSKNGKLRAWIEKA